jgi:hypothetical protein
MQAQITARDVAILLDLYQYRYLSFSQLVRLHFPSRFVCLVIIFVCKLFNYGFIFMNYEPHMRRVN